MTRLVCLIALRQVTRIDGWEKSCPDVIPSCLSSTTALAGKRFLPAVLILARGGRTVRFLADWNFRLIPGMGNLSISVTLIRAVTRETLERGYIHYITDVFESGPHSPHGFHTRGMGFDSVATHDHGELQCTSRHITMVLDLKAAYQRLRRCSDWIFRALTADWDEKPHLRMA